MQSTYKSNENDKVVNASTIESFLSQLELSEYVDKFKTRGYTNVQHVINTMT